MKSGRHEKILSIISEYSIETQDELLKKLKEAGYKATQATISRDIKELRLVKTLGSDGKYRYAAVSNGADIRSTFASLFSGSVVKTLSGMANAVCAALDSMDNTVVVGTIAGDDTIFIACRSTESAVNLCDTLKQIHK